MPFSLYNRRNRKLNELIDQVKALSDTVDELRAEVNAIKISSELSSGDNPAGSVQKCTKIQNQEYENEEKKYENEESIFEKLKKCLENSFIFMQKKCQEIFTQSAKKNSPASVSSQDSIHHHPSSVKQTESFKSLLRFSPKFCNIFTGAEKIEQQKTTKKKTASTSMTPKESKEDITKYPVESVKLRGVTFVDDKKTADPEINTSTTASTSSSSRKSSEYNLPGCRVIYEKPKKDIGIQNTPIRIDSKTEENAENKISRSIDCTFFDEVPVQLEEDYTNTIFDDSTGTKFFKISKKGKQRKILSTQKTQTSSTSSLTSSSSQDRKYEQKYITPYEVKIEKNQTNPKAPVTKSPVRDFIKNRSKRTYVISSNISLVKKVSQLNNYKATNSRSYFPKLLLKSSKAPKTRKKETKNQCTITCPEFQSSLQQSSSSFSDDTCSLTSQ